MLEIKKIVFNLKIMVTKRAKVIVIKVRIYEINLIPTNSKIDFFHISGKAWQKYQLKTLSLLVFKNMFAFLRDFFYYSKSQFMGKKLL